jgi:hypothetical protein
VRERRDGALALLDLRLSSLINRLGNWVVVAFLYRIRGVPELGGDPPSAPAAMLIVGGEGVALSGPLPTNPPIIIVH